MKKLLLFTTFLVSLHYAWTQREVTMYSMESLYQSSYVNPTAEPKHKVSVGLPAISSLYAGTAFPISGKDIIVDNTISPSYMIDNLDDGLYNLTYINVDLFHLRFRAKKTFINLSLRARGESNLMIDKDLLSLAWNGNGSFIDNNQAIDLEHMGNDQSAFTEIGVGFSRKFWKKWTLGAKVKALFGVANIHSDSKDASIYFDPDTYEMQLLGGYTINTAVLPDIDEGGDPELEDFAKLNTKNFGLGLDLGAKYELSEKVSFSASLVDLGYIKWNDNPINYELSSSAVLKGVDGIKLLLEGADADSVRDAWIDNIEDSVDYVTTNNAYSTALDAQFYLNGTYKITNTTKVYSTLNMFLWRGLRTSFSIGLHQSISRWFSFTVNNTWQYNRIFNLGVGLMFKPGPFQIYIVSDNIFVGRIKNAKIDTDQYSGNFYFPQYMTNANIRVGINLVFGKIQVEDKVY